MNTIYNLAFCIVLVTIIKISYNPKDVSNISEVVSNPDETINKNIEEPKNIISYETIEEIQNIIDEEIIKETENIIREESIKEPFNITPEIVIKEELPANTITEEEIKKISLLSAKVDEVTKAGWCCSSY